MLQTVYIRENREKVIEALGKRNIDAVQMVDDVIALDENADLHKWSLTLFYRNLTNCLKTLAN